MSVFIGGQLYVQSVPRRPTVCVDLRRVDTVEITFTWPRSECKVTAK